MKRVELLAPAKGYEAARAAVDHGADAVYMGATHFGARAAATNSLEDVARAVEYAHQYGVRLYATLNTLLFESELEQAQRMAQEVVSAGVDALIVQDMAYARMGLGVDLHCSTQMSNMSVEGVQFLSECGFRRIVMERNLSLRDIQRVASALPDVELEAFVHGAICVGHSGRCYLSRSMSPRSGNRGECSQPCRLSYDLVDGAGQKIMEAKHLLSVKDLNLSQRLGDMLDAGVSSFKIEGRLKELSYTKNIVAHYRRELDRVISEREGYERSSVGRSRIEFVPNPVKSFSRGETTYMFDGSRSGVASFESPKSKGESLGRCVAVRGESFALEYSGQISTGDGLCFVKDGALIGGGVNRVERRDDKWWITLSRAGRVAVDTMIYRNFDRAFDASVESSRTRRTIGVRGALISSPARIEVRYRDRERDIECSARIEGEFEQAKSSGKMAEVITTQLSKCGDTIFDVESVDLSGWGGEFITSGQLSALRREALERLREANVEATKSSRPAPFEEQREARYPVVEILSDVGVVNSLAEQFFGDHGVRRFEPQLEVAEKFEGEKVLESSYCLRREIGECLKRGSKLKSPIYLVRGADKFRVDSECGRCRMSLVKM